MTPKEILKHFKSAAWKGEQELQTFLFVVPEDAIDSATLQQMLEVLTNKRLSADLSAHALRCKAFAQLAAPCKDKALFVPYLKALQKGDSRVRSLLTGLLPQVNDVKAHNQLCQLLRASEPRVREAAAEVIKQVGGKTALQLITDLVDRPDFPGRLEAMDALMPIAGHYAVPVLAALIRVANPDEKAKALRYLGDAHYMAKAKAAALEAIRPSLADSSAKVASQAIESFAAVAEEDQFFEDVGPYLESGNPALVRATVAALGNYSSPNVILALEKRLRAGPALVQLQVLQTAEAIGDDSVLPLLAEGLSNSQLQVRTKASEVMNALSQARKINAAQVVRWLLRSRDVNVRRMALEVARSVPDPSKLWPRLLDLMRDEDWWVRERVMDVLVEMAGKQLTYHIVQLLEDPYDVIRRFAVDVLMRLEDVQALGPLVKTARGDRDWWVREKAVEAIAQLKDVRAIPYLLEILQRDPETVITTIGALVTLEARQALPQIVPLLQASDADVRLQALRAVQGFNAADQAPLVQPLTQDDDQRVANLARELLVHWNIRLQNEAAAETSGADSLLDRLLIAMSEQNADDLLLTPDRPPFMKKLGRTLPLSDRPLTGEQIKSLVGAHLTVGQMEQLNQMQEIDFSHGVKSRGLRFRANLFLQHGGVGAVFRAIKGKLASFETLGLPEVVRSFAEFRHGLVLFGGATGSGKSTSLAAIIDYINQHSKRHVISLEDPIEVVHQSKRALVNQREIGTHTKSFGAALRSTLRQDPDVILVGEMRDLDTISFAVTAADTGHLIFGTLHTVSVDTSVDRLINAYPPAEQHQVRASLADNLRAVVCQHLVRKRDGSGRVLAAEVMINNDAIASMIRKGKTYQIPSILLTSGEQGMQTMDSQLLQLYQGGVISAEEAYMKANVKKDFEQLVVDEREGRAPGGAAAPQVPSRLDDSSAKLPALE